MPQVSLFTSENNNNFTHHKLSIDLKELAKNEEDERSAKEVNQEKEKEES
jgi:hypothetical protein